MQGSLTRGYFEVSNRLIFRNADVVLANSEEMVGIAERIGAHQAALMGTPVSPLFLRQDPPRAPAAVRSVLFAGRLAAEKNLEGLIESARALPQLQYSIAGDGPQRALVEAAAQELPNLNYIGWLDREGLLAAMGQPRCADSAQAMWRASAPSRWKPWRGSAWSWSATPAASPTGRNWPSRCWSKSADEDVTAVLRRALQLSEFEVAARARQARQAVVKHNDANLSLWLDFITGVS